MTENKKKYILLENDFLIYKGTKLFRIKYLTDIDEHGVKAGDLGGYLESESNLSHDGCCVVLDDAKVYGGALVERDAKVCHNARICSYARICGCAEIYESAVISGYTKIYAYAKVGGEAQVYDNAKVGGYAEVLGKAEVGWDSRILEGTITGVFKKNRFVFE